MGWSGMTLAIDGRADVPLRHLIVRQENKVLAGGRAAQAGEQSDVLAGGTYWLGPGSERPRQRRKASLAVIGSALVPAVAFQPPSHSSKPLSPVVP